jgi:hypothetical protein
MNASESLDNSADEAPAESCMPQVLQFVGGDAACIESMTDESLREYESACFHRFEAAATKAEQHNCVHEMARCIVEMTNRGMPLNGGKQ